MRRAPPLPTVLALWASGLCAAAQFSKVALVLPELGAVYPDAGPALGFLVSSISVVGILFGLVAGLLVVRVGSRRLLLGGLAAGALASLVQATLPPLPLLLGARVLEGGAHLAIVVAAPTLIADVAGERWRPAAMTLWGTFFGVSFALTAWLGLPLVAAHGPGALLFAHGIVTGVAAIPLVLLLPPDAPRARVTGTRATAVPSPFAPRELARRHLLAWTSPSVAAPAAGWLFYTLTFVALLAVLPGLVPPGERAFAAAGMPLASIVSSMTAGVVLMRRIGAVGVVLTGFSLAAALALSLTVVPVGPWPCLALFAALGLVQGASFAAVPELNATPASRALANGAMAQAGNLGNALGTPLLLALLTGAGFGAMMALVVACCVSGIAVHVSLAARRRGLGDDVRSDPGP